MELGRILDGPPEPSLLPGTLDGVSREDEATVEGPRDYALLTPMSSFQQTLTDQVVSLHYSDILKLYETTEPVMPESLETMYRNASLVAAHPYLLANHYLPHSLLLKDVPALLGRESGKFAILGDLVDLFQGMAPMHVAVIARPGKTIDLLEAFLLGKFVNYKRYEGSYLREPGESDDDYPTIHLIPSSGLEPAHLAGSKFDLLLGFDATLDLKAPHVEAIRSQGRESIAPVVRLIVRNSVEHIILRVDPVKEENGSADSSNHTMKRVLAAIVLLRGSVGTLPAELKALYNQHLRPLQPWFKNTEMPWPLPGLAHIQTYTPADVERSLLTEVETSEGQDVNGSERTSNSSNPGYYSTKRLKREEDYAGARENAHDPPPNLLTHALIQKLAEAQARNDRLNDELKDHRNRAESRQTAYEELQEEMKKMVERNATLESNLSQAERKIERVEMDSARNIERLERANQEIEELKTTIQEGPLDKSLFDEQRQKISHLEAELTKANERISSREADNEYMRNEYQRASTAAAEAHSEIHQLKEDKKGLLKRLEGEAIRLRALTFDEERASKDEKIKELSSKISLLEEHLKRVLESEKSTVGRSRYASRASSVPRKTKSPSRTHSPNNDGHPLQNSITNN